MRELYLNLHVKLGALVVWVLLIWSLTGAAMTLDRFIIDLRAPGLKPLGRSLEPAAFRFPPASIKGIEGADKIELVQRGKLAFYDVRFKDGSLTAYEAGTGKPLLFDYDPKGMAEELAPWAALSGHTVKSVELMKAKDDFYRGEVPVWKAVLEGRGSPYVYVNPRSGRVEKVVSRPARMVRWAEALHRFNFQSWQRDFDVGRRIIHALAIAVPVFAIALLGLGLLSFRRRIF